MKQHRSAFIRLPGLLKKKKKEKNFSRSAHLPLPNIKSSPPANKPNQKTYSFIFSSIAILNTENLFFTFFYSL
jgi:hypothetical protein